LGSGQIVSDGVQAVGARYNLTAVLGVAACRAGGLRLSYCLLECPMPCTPNAPSMRPPCALHAPPCAPHAMRLWSDLKKAVLVVVADDGQMSAISPASRTRAMITFFLLRKKPHVFMSKKSVCRPTQTFVVLCRPTQAFVVLCRPM
jgi:hypothetical protein